MGLSLGDYITMALTRLVYSQDIPFETKVNDPYVGRSGRIRLTSSIQEAEQGNYKYHELIEE
jgi:antitoxin component of RelBE/YafQ-DinJ toxin-antitoxin module